MITVCHHSASLVMPNGDPRDWFFYPILALMMDSYTLIYLQYLTGLLKLINSCGNFTTHHISLPLGKNIDCRYGGLHPGITKKKIIINAVFSKENYVPPPPNHNFSRQACLLLFIVSHWSINYFKGEHAQTQFWSNFEITKCCGYREYKVKVIKI